MHNFNRYAYANNNPYKYTDPTGMCVEDLCFVEGGLAVGTALVYAGATIGVAAGCIDFCGGIVDAIDDFVGNIFNESSAPDLPDGLVGDQGSDEAGPNKSGKRHTSGTLTPGNGGTGVYEEDLETLAGETRPSVPGDSAPPGSQIGENGVYGRPENTSGGRSIEIPGNGDKPHESLHYPPKQ